MHTSILLAMFIRKAHPMKLHLKEVCLNGTAHGNGTSLLACSRGLTAEMNMQPGKLMCCSRGLTAPDEHAAQYTACSSAALLLMMHVCSMIIFWSAGVQPGVPVNADVKWHAVNADVKWHAWYKLLCFKL